MQIRIKCLDKFKPLITKKKRVKILLGGRSSTKTTFVSDHVLTRLMSGKIWCCSREYQNSIDDSVYRTLNDEIDRLKINGFSSTATNITHASGGYAFFKGLARNITSLKGMLSGVEGLWIEEGESISENTLRVLTASLRNSAKDAQKYLDSGETDIEMPEIWITMNRGSREDPIAKKFLERAEEDLAVKGYYEDDFMLIVHSTYLDMPRKWWELSGLEQERSDDEKVMTPQQYRHKWHGDYLETIENAIIQPEWFDSCVDAHIKLGFEPLGQERCAYDPSDTGEDPAAWGYQHGPVVLDVKELDGNNIVDKTDLAIKETMITKPDVFTWDCDGMGAGLNYQVSQGLNGKKIQIEQFKGSLSPENPNAIYQRTMDVEGQKNNKETFVNWRAQFYTLLADKMLRTHLAVTRNIKVINPDDLISFSSGIKQLQKLKSELCRIPQKEGGRIQILSKPEMKSKGIKSPNMGDVVMMLQRQVKIKSQSVDLVFKNYYS